LLTCFTSFSYISRKIHYEKTKWIGLQEAKEAAVQEARMNGSRRAHVKSFGNGWEGGIGGK